MSRTDEYQITLKRERDNKSFGTWKTTTGWGVTAPDTTTRDGYGQPRKQLGGPATKEPITATRVFYPGGSEANAPAELEAGVGRDRFEAVKQKLDPEGNATGMPQVVRKTMLKDFKPSDVDVGDESPSADEYTVELSVEG